MSLFCLSTTCFEELLVSLQFVLNPSQDAIVLVLISMIPRSQLFCGFNFTLCEKPYFRGQL
eukprot:m.532461 g.532461  ORF g.532461 m.532461 type:complete len:61 (-) comp57596_c0_seq4:2245-2427(-)